MSLEEAVDSFISEVGAAELSVFAVDARVGQHVAVVSRHSLLEKFKYENGCGKFYDFFKTIARYMCVKITKLGRNFIEMCLRVPSSYLKIQIKSWLNLDVDNREVSVGGLVRPVGESGQSTSKLLLIDVA
jgi:hypothetical protein